jgi:integrase/recombinase XerD
VTRSGTPLTYNGITCVLRRARGKSGIARLHTHLLRHPFSVAALQSGIDLMTLKETLGHEDIRTTAIYLSMSEAQLIKQQRNVNPIARVTFPKAVRKADRSAK